MGKLLTHILTLTSVYRFKSLFLLFFASFSLISCRINTEIRGTIDDSSNAFSLSIESKADGSGSVVSKTTINELLSTDLYLISRDKNGNFIKVVEGTWESQSLNLQFATKADKGVSIGSSVFGLTTLNANYLGESASTQIEVEHAPKINFSLANQSFSEWGFASLKVDLDRSATIPLEFTISSTDISAQLGADFDPFDLQVKIPPGATEAYVNIPLNFDQAVEADETFQVNILAGKGVYLGTQLDSTVTILNDDTAPISNAAVSAGSNILRLSGGHGCYITTSGGIECWGQNNSGQLGNNTTVDAFSPVSVNLLTSNVSAISNNFFWASTTAVNTCAIQSGAAFCWGANNLGQLGNGNTVDSHVPVPVSGLGANVTSISVAGDFACAIQSDILKCWGEKRHVNDGPLGEAYTTP